MGYFEARRNRAIRNDDALKNLADKLVRKDPTIQAYINRNETVHESIVFIRGEELCSITFTTVPFKWNGPSKKSAKNQENIAMPYTPEDVLDSFHTVKNVKHRHDTYFKSMEEYLGWCTYLVPYEN